MRRRHGCSDVSTRYELFALVPMVMYTGMVPLVMCTGTLGGVYLVPLVMHTDSTLGHVHQYRW
jgi:hypothetical protein